MTDLRHRPRFARTVTADQSCILRELSGPSVRDDSAVECTVFESSAVLRIRPDLEHTWSPQLEISFENSGDEDSCLLHGLFGPRPSVWTSFIAGYLFFLCVGFIGFVFGLSSYWIGMDARALWLVPVAGLGMAGVFIMARVGRTLGQDQMGLLLGCLTTAVEHCESGSSLPDPLEAGTQ